MSSDKENKTVAVTPSMDHPYLSADFKTAKRDGRALNTDRSDILSEDTIDRETVLTALTTKQELRLIRRVDWRLMPLLCLLYLVKKLDETNVSLLWRK